jgi:hypothetical protein
VEPGNGPPSDLDLDPDPTNKNRRRVYVVGRKGEKELVNSPVNTL